MEDKSRQGLFAPLLVGNLSFKDCGCVSATQGSSNGHEWFLIKPDHQTMVCAVCRSKVHVSIPADHQCISGQHHYHSYESSDFESRAACCKCHFPLIFIRVERRIQPEAWAKFLARDEKDQSNAVAFLMRLVRDFMNGKVRIGKANTGNKFFLENIGTWEDNGFVHTLCYLEIVSFNHQQRLNSEGNQLCARRRRVYIASTGFEVKSGD